MLLLTRRPHERIMLLREGKIEVTITVCEVNGRQVKIGIDAPDEVDIQREELLEDDA